MNSEKVSLRVILENNDQYVKRVIDFDGSNKLTINFLRLCVTESDEDLKVLTCWCKPVISEQEISYIRILDDKLLNFLVFDYWSKCSEFEIIFRNSNSNSSNSTSPKMLHIDSNVIISHVSLAGNEVCPLSQVKVSEIPIGDRATISNIQHTIVVDSNFLLDFIRSQLYKKNHLFEIKLKADGHDGSPINIVFDHIVWSNYLLRKHKTSNEILQQFTSICERTVSYEQSLKNFQKTKDELYMKIKLYVSDLMHFSNDVDARNRLESGDLFYMSEYYFTEMEKIELLNFPTSSGLKLSDCLNFLTQEKFNSGSHEICASHDIAPVFLKVFGIQKGFDKEKNFKDFKKCFLKTLKK